MGLFGDSGKKDRPGGMPHFRYFAWPHFAVKILNSYRSLASRSEQKTSVLPSGENSGNDVNPPKSVTCSSSEPSALIRYSSNFRLSQACLFEENRIFPPSGVNVGAKLAHPKFVIARGFFPSAPATISSIFMGAVRFSASS